MKEETDFEHPVVVVLSSHFNLHTSFTTRPMTVPIIANTALKARREYVKKTLMEAQAQKDRLVSKIARLTAELSRIDKELAKKKQ